MSHKESDRTEQLHFLFIRQLVQEVSFLQVGCWS